MKKFLLLLICLDVSYPLLSVEEKTRKQKTRDFLTSKPMMVVYGAVGGSITINFFLYDALKKTVEELKAKNNDLEKTNQNHDDDLKKEYDKKIQQLEQDKIAQMKERDLLAGGFIFLVRAKKYKNGIKDVVQEWVRENKFFELKNINNTFVVCMRDSISIEAVSSLIEFKDWLTAYNKIAELFEETKVTFANYYEHDREGIIFKDFIPVQSSQLEQSSTPASPNIS